MILLKLNNTHCIDLFIFLAFVQNDMLALTGNYYVGFIGVLYKMNITTLYNIVYKYILACIIKM